MYGEFARFYDRLEGDAAQRSAAWVSARLDALRPRATDVLELGCGTGAVLAALPSGLRKVGLDQSPAMLAEARRAGVPAEWHEGDLTDFDLGRDFDVVLCVFDTLNHVTDRSGWASAFRAVRRHLRPGGLFLLDVNTTGRLAYLAAAPPWVHDFDGNTLILDVRDVGEARVDWDIRVFEPQPDGHFALTREVIAELGVPLADLTAMLSASGLEVLEVHDDQGGPVTDDSTGRAFLVTRRPVD